MDQLIHEPQNIVYQARFDILKEHLGEPAARELFKKTKKMDKEALSWRKETDCGICWAEDTQPAYLLPCPCRGSLYHSECLKLWWDQLNIKPSCPTCRAAIVTIVHRQWVTTDLAQKEATKKLRKRKLDEKRREETKRQKLVQRDQKLVQKLEAEKFFQFRDTRPLPPIIAPAAQSPPIVPPVQPNADPVRAETRPRPRPRPSGVRGRGRPSNPSSPHLQPFIANAPTFSQKDKLSASPLRLLPSFTLRLLCVLTYHFIIQLPDVVRANEWEMKGQALESRLRRATARLARASRRPWSVRIVKIG
ncbi:hypothetical protein BDZ89DRAFT_1151088 [Hymenopellis radicata]|nr:hypothetical protein BDZ89DRAFT_1151088 [Hymenopellis radicata]